MGSLAMKVVVAMCLACALAVDARGGPPGGGELAQCEAALFAARCSAGLCLAALVKHDKHGTSY